MILGVFYFLIFWFWTGKSEYIQIFGVLFPMLMQMAICSMDIVSIVYTWLREMTRAWASVLLSCFWWVDNPIVGNIFLKPHMCCGRYLNNFFR
jgi:hypothetical protein